MQNTINEHEIKVMAELKAIDYLKMNALKQRIHKAEDRELGYMISLGIASFLLIVMACLLFKAYYA